MLLVPGVHAYWIVRCDLLASMNLEHRKKSDEVTDVAKDVVRLTQELQDLKVCVCVCAA